MRHEWCVPHFTSAAYGMAPTSVALAQAARYYVLGLHYPIPSSGCTTYPTTVCNHLLLRLVPLLAPYTHRSTYKFQGRRMPACVYIPIHKTNEVNEREEWVIKAEGKNG